ncbi:MAG: cyclic nucleotide-binding domain-containing protein [Planctomycetota bacterium]|nr:cyclic nucleotide-binding domain-containing protein [Planctomycetota bacterium]
MPPKIDPKQFGENPIFQGLSENHRKMILGGGIVNRYSTGENIFLEGETGEAMYLILSGKVEIQVQNKSGLAEVVGRLKAGEIFGEGSLITDAPRSGTAAAVRDTYLIAFSRKTLHDLIENHPKASAHFMYKIMKSLFIRLRATTQKLSRK